MESTIESQIIAECRNGNWANFSLIYDEYLPKIYRYVYYRTRHKQTAEDLTSTVFTKAVSGLPGFRAETGMFAPWLYRIARNVLIDAARANKPTLDLAAAVNAPSEHDVLADADTVLKRESIKAALGQLSPQQQEIVMMRVWDELSHREIGEILEISEGNAKITFSRAVAALKELIPLT